MKRCTEVWSRKFIFERRVYSGSLGKGTRAMSKEEEHSTSRPPRICTASRHMIEKAGSWHEK